MTEELTNTEPSTVDNPTVATDSPDPADVTNSTPPVAASVPLVDIPAPDPQPIPEPSPSVLAINAQDDALAAEGLAAMDAATPAVAGTAMLDDEPLPEDEFQQPSDDMLAISTKSLPDQPPVLRMANTVKGPAPFAPPQVPSNAEYWVCVTPQGPRTDCRAFLVEKIPQQGSLIACPYCGGTVVRRAKGGES